ncbi:MAG: tRNA (adenosine(37)-N6)-threonylcarbamoyltransferase complex ATPase subunit type 1 TsaE [Actinomycetota bacterium]
MEETRRLAVALTPSLRPGDVIALGGPLGVGKTAFVQGIGVGLGIPGHVTSPSFILMKEYLGGRYPLLHLDVYRLDRMQELLDLGLDEFLEPSHIVIVEWGDMVEPLLPKEHLLVEMARGDSDTVRVITLEPRGQRWETRMDTVRMLISELFWASRETDQQRGEPLPGGYPKPEEGDRGG